METKLTRSELEKLLNSNIIIVNPENAIEKEINSFKYKTDVEKEKVIDNILSSQER